jgi:hypothetical protein
MKSHGSGSLGDQEKRIQKVGKAKPKTLSVWEEFLNENLSFPFEAKVSESQSKCPLRFGDELKVKKIELVDDLYGIIVEVWHQRKKYAFPLCDLEVLDTGSTNYQHVEDYCVWFANR